MGRDTQGERVFPDKPNKPDTGDSNNLTGMLGLAGFSATGRICVFAYKRCKMVS